MKIVKLLPLIFGICYLLPVPALAEDIYVAQSAVGADSGANAANAHAAGWFNTSANWTTASTADGKVGPGDILHLCGTISTALTIQGSGAAGQPITMFFESGAKLSKAHWNQNGANRDAAIYGNGVSFLAFDGGVNGIIECTDSGTNFAYQLDSFGIRLTGSSHILIQNLTIEKIFVRVAGSSGAYGNCIRFDDPSHDITIQNNRLSDAIAGVSVSYGAGDRDIFLHDNEMVNFGEGAIVVGSARNSATASNVLIFNNNLSKGLGTWSGNPAIHTNCIHVFAVQANTRVDGLKIYNNTVTGDWGTNSTSYIFVEQYVYGPLIYNNLIIVGDSGAGGGNGFIFLKYSPGGAVIANNTFVGKGWGNGIFASGGGATLYNNLFYDVGAPIMCPYDTTGIASCDNNIYWRGNIFTFGDYSQMTFSQWKVATGFDAHSVVTQPSLDVNHVPKAADTVARDQGINLSAYFTTDKKGVSRPQGSAWDIGAYEYVPAASQSIQLNQGWNWISFNVLPTTLSLDSVFNGILSQVEQVKAQTQSAIRSSGAWKSDLADMSGIGQFKMYKVKVSATCTLTVTGTAVLSATPIPLISGWNWVAYLPATAMPIATALASINGQVQEVKSLTQAATYSGGAWSGSLTQLNPGQGYAIKMNAPGTLTYPAGK